MGERALTGELRQLLGEALGRDAAGVAGPDDLVEKLGIDSLGALRLLAMVELRYGVRFPDRHLKDFRTLDGIADFVEAHPGEQNVCSKGEGQP